MGGGRNGEGEGEREGEGRTFEDFARLTLLDLHFVDVAFVVTTYPSHQYGSFY